MLFKKKIFIVMSVLFTIPIIANNEIIHSAMNFPMQHVVNRYKKDYKVSDDLAKKHEIELKRYLILCSLYSDSLPMLSGEVDNLWHTFILFTKDYEAFCKCVAHKYLHHVPFTEEEKLQNDVASAYNEFVHKYLAVFHQVPSDKIWNINKDNNSALCAQQI